MSRSTVVMAEDHPAVADQLCQLLARDFEVIAVVADGQALVDVVEKLSPDIVVTDISMPKMDGIEAAHLILQRHPQTSVIVLTAHSDLNLVRKGISVGCRGYVLKSSAGEELLPAIRKVLQGGVFLSPELSSANVIDELTRSCVQ